MSKTHPGGFWSFQNPPRWVFELPKPTAVGFEMSEILSGGLWRSSRCRARFRFKFKATPQGEPHEERKLQREQTAKPEWALNKIEESRSSELSKHPPRKKKGGALKYSRAQALETSATEKKGGALKYSRTHRGWPYSVHTLFS